MYAIADVGGTNTRLAVAEDRLTLLKKDSFTTPKSFVEGISTITEKIKSLAEGSEISSLVMGIPGTVDRKSGKSINTPNIPDWSNQEIVKIFQSRICKKAALVNDAELAALGEANFGAGKGYRIAAYLTISTGIGGALVVDNKIVKRTHNSEPGHMVIDLASTVEDGTGRKGTWESLASGTAFEKRYGIKAEDCRDEEIWRKQAEVLGEGLINVILLWSPEILVIGGGLSQAGDLLFRPLRKMVEKNIKVFPAPRIEPAQLGDDAGLYGGLLLI